jgi:hypothetical protein
VIAVEERLSIAMRAARIAVALHGAEHGIPIITRAGDLSFSRGIDARRRGCRRRAAPRATSRSACPCRGSRSRSLRQRRTRHRDRRALPRLVPRKIARRIARRIDRRIDRIVALERRKELAPHGEALLRSWKRVHVPFSIVLLVTMLVHIALALHLG